MTCHSKPFQIRGRHGHRHDRCDHHRVRHRGLHDRGVRVLHPSLGQPCRRWSGPHLLFRIQERIRLLQVRRCRQLYLQDNLLLLPSFPLVLRGCGHRDRRGQNGRHDHRQHGRGHRGRHLILHRQHARGHRGHHLHDRQHGRGHRGHHLHDHRQHGRGHHDQGISVRV